MSEHSLHFYEPYDPEAALAAYSEAADFERYPEQLEQPDERPLPGQIGGVAIQLSFWP